MCFFLQVLKSKHTVKAHYLHLRIRTTHRQLGRLAALTGPWVWAPGFSGSCRCSGQLAWLCPPLCWRVYHSLDNPAPAAPPMGSAKWETLILEWGVLRVKGCTNIILQMFESIELVTSFNYSFKTRVSSLFILPPRPCDLIFFTNSRWLSSTFVSRTMRRACLCWSSGVNTETDTKHNYPSKMPWFKYINFLTRRLL